jgi:hypothetical protein
MKPGHWRQPQIIRLLAGTAFAVLLLPGHASAQVPCVSCLVIGVDATDLESAPAIQGALEGVQLLVTGAGRLDSLMASGAGIAILVTPSSDSTVPEIVFAARTAITALRAEHPDLHIVIDAAAFEARGVSIDDLRAYVDAVIGETWARLPAVSRSTVDDLVEASLTPGAERVLLPVERIDWRAVEQFAARRATQVDVTGARRLTVAEIVARYQAQQRRQDAIVHTTIADGSTTLLFEVPDFSAPITITADTTIFRDGAGTDAVTNIEERDIRVNGAAIAGGSAQSAPQLPLLEAQRISTPPLTITLDDAYRYALDGDDDVGGTRCFVVGFEPRSVDRGLARGRAWISATDFTLRRLETIQRDLRGAIVSSDQVVEFARFAVGRAMVWLPVETRVFQSYVGAGFQTPIHRTISSPHYVVNDETFASRLRQALTSDNVMLQDTPDGLRYLVRRRGDDTRSVATSGSHAVRSLIGGVIVDPNISVPLPYAGISYINLDVRGSGAQVNAFFGGVFGQASWTLPSIRGTRWQAHGTAFGIAAHYSDRVFRNGREQFAENLVQRPEQAAVGLLRPLTPRLRATVDYSIDATTLARTADTPARFVVPRTIINHGIVLALEGDRGPWTLRGWWNPVRRQGWRAWGLPGTFSTSTRDYQRFGARLTRTIALRSSLSSRLEMAWMSGHDLDRFSRFGFDSFDNPLHGYPTAAIRYDRGTVIRSATAWSGHGWRLDGFGDAALVHDPGWTSALRAYPGVGAAVESGGPFRTLLSLEWGYGFKGRQENGHAGTQTARVTVYRGF